MAKLVRYSGSSDWSALYVDGKLDIVADHYLVDERISEICGVEVHDSDDFMRGGKREDDVAPTLLDLHGYTSKREAAETEAARLRAQADELMRLANAVSPDSKRG